MPATSAALLSLPMREDQPTETKELFRDLTVGFGDDRAQGGHAEIGVFALVVEATVVNSHIRTPLDVNFGRGGRREKYNPSVWL